MSADEKNKVIENAAAMRARQVCESGGVGVPLHMYGEKLNYLLEQLGEEGIKDQADIDKATGLFDKKIKESCPDLFPN